MNIILIDENDLVSAVIVAESVAFIQANKDKWPHAIAIDGTGISAAVGYTHDDGAFIAPPEREPEQQYETVMDSQTFLLLLSPEELELLRLSETPLLVATEYLFRIRNGEVNTESDIFKEVMDAAVSTGILTQERADELSLGIPYQYV